MSAADRTLGTARRVAGYELRGAKPKRTLLERPAERAASGPRFEVVARTDAELRWTSHLYCGLYDLEQDGCIRMRLRPRVSLHPSEVFAVVLEVTDTHTGETRRLAVDYRDNADVLCSRKLAEVDVYYKRNFIRGITDRVCPDGHAERLRPAGLSFPVRGVRERPYWALVVGGLHRTELPVIRRSLRATLGNFYKAGFASPMMVRRFLKEDDFRASVADATREIVLFQTKAYEPPPTSFADDTKQVNDDRAGTIRALREAFGDRFVGGFMPSEYAAREYPDCVSTLSSEQADYSKVMRSARVCVYTRGLRDSPAFKLAEYMAAGRCIVAERLRTELPQPIEDGREAVFYDRMDELLGHCENLLSDPHSAERLSANALAYYQAEVRPRERVRRLLVDAFATGEADSPSNFRSAKG